MFSCWVVAWLAFLLQVRAGKVLLMPSSLEPIHRESFKPLAAELVQRGHQVTWFEYGLKKPSDPLPSGVVQQYVQVSVADRSLLDLYLHRNHSHYARLWHDDYWAEAERADGWLASAKLCEQVLANKGARKQFDQLVHARFDAVVLDDLYNPCGLLHAGLQKSVYIYWSLTGLRTESAWAHHSPSPPSYIPAPGSALTDELDMLQRAKNMVQYLRNLYVHHRLVLPQIDALAKKYLAKEKLVSAFDLERNASLNFVNHFPIFDFARPYMPRVNFVGCLQCRNATKLPKKLNEFLSNVGEEGFVVISSGHSNQWETAPEETKKNLIEAIRAKPKIKFVWQSSPVAAAPANLFTGPWLPLQDLLGHPDCKAHVSHGGLNSVMESMWHGVPVIGWPLTIHNKDNLLRVTARHAGLMMDKKNPSRNGILSAINRIYVTHYKEEALIFQDMVTDVPYTELNHAAFWVEFVIRHQEVPHARSGADELNILQYFLVDVIAFLLSVIFLLVSAIHYTLKLIIMGIVRLIAAVFRRIGRKSGAVKVDKKKKQN